LLFLDIILDVSTRVPVRATMQSPQDYIEFTISPESPNKTEWELLGMTTILNTTKIHSNLVEQCWHNQGMVVTRWSETLIEVSKIFTKKGKELSAVTIKVEQYLNIKQLSYAKSTHLEQYIPMVYSLSTANSNKAHLLWQWYNHLGIPSSMIEILLFNSAFYDGVILLSVS